MSRGVIKYVYSDELIRQADKNTAVRKRASMTHELIKCYNLLEHMRVVQATKCNSADLRWYHTKEYINQYNAYPLSESNKQIKAEYATDDSSSSSEDDDDDGDDDDAKEKSFIEKYGLAFECHPWLGIKDYLYSIAGATMTACEELCRSGKDQPRQVIINWTGGWHHARHDRAAGYCYVNDIVLGVLVLRKRYKRVLYIDLDVHHGDGVEEAFLQSKNVFTLSFHRYDAGFYPCTGLPEDCGKGPGQGYAANFGYASGFAGDTYVKYFKRVAARIFDAYKPDCCVIQCGGDVIMGDPMAWTNIKPQHVIECVNFALNYELPTLLLGGGGYNFENTSRLWTLITAEVCGQKLNDDIPDSNRYFLKYGPGYDLHIKTELYVRDENVAEDLDNAAAIIENNLVNYKVGTDSP